MDESFKKLWVLLAAALVILIIIIAAWPGNKPKTDAPVESEDAPAKPGRY